MTPDEVFMKNALDEAKIAFENGEIPVGAVIVENGEIIARGRNHREKDNDITGHAEISALRSAAKIKGDWRLPRCTIYVTLEPCAMCAGAIIEARLERVVFGAKDEKKGAAGSILNILDYPGGGGGIPVTGGVLEEECGYLMRKFFRRDG
ncbi:MAG: tRNA adenosine(34) deaminase TadA [Candidatus Eremiobacteraeota bacterium]|nr:tRNA adenosine(34) deaminase TadA [Candidatus Eremiobacteraeota bacterium]